MEPITVTLLDSQTILGVKILGIDLGVLGTTQEFISEFFQCFPLLNLGALAIFTTQSDFPAFGR